MTAAPPIGSFVPGAQVNSDAGVDLEALLAFILQLLGGNAQATLTISGGAVTPTRALHLVDTEGAGASDDLDRLAITNLPPGSLVVLRSVDAGRDVRVRSGQGGAGQILLQNPAGQGSTFTLADPSMALVLARIAGDAWGEIGRWYGTQNGAMRSYLGLSDAATMPVASTAEMQALAADDRVVTPVKLTTALNTFERVLEDRGVETNRWLNSWLLIGRSAADAGGVSWLRRISLDNLLGASFRSYAESSEIALTANTSGTVDMGFGAQPRLFEGFLRNKTAEGGWNPGDEVKLDASNFGETARVITLASYNSGVAYAIPSTGSQMVLVNYTNRSQFLVTPGSWRLVVRGWR